MTPYDSLPRQHFWKASAQLADEVAVDFDFGRKFTFEAADAFATAGSCFAQHFARHLAARGGNLLVPEDRHPLIPADSEHGFRTFSARYGNIYTVRHLRELIEQALGLRDAICEFAKRKDGRWVDMVRPRAVPMGFSNPEHARADRLYHLHAVRQMLQGLDVFVFTLGLTEAWENVQQSFCYPVVPGAIAGEFSPETHRFANYSCSEVVADLGETTRLIGSVNPDARILLTVSPVGLAATAERRNVMVSTSASKGILRAAVDEVVRKFPVVDYFPSYEIITGPYGRGRYWAEDCREVTNRGVDVVMEVFVQSRLAALPKSSIARPAPASASNAEASNQLETALDAECDELFLDPSQRAGSREM